MLMAGSSETTDESTVQSSDNTMTRSNFERLRPRLLAATDLITQPMPAIATPIVLAATE